MMTEPVLAAITALVAAAIVLLVAFGVNISDDQKEAIGAFIVALYGVAVFIRSKVTPTAVVPVTVTRTRKRAVK